MTPAELAALAGAVADAIAVRLPAPRASDAPPHDSEAEWQAAALALDGEAEVLALDANTLFSRLPALVLAAAQRGARDAVALDAALAEGGVPSLLRLEAIDRVTLRVAYTRPPRELAAELRRLARRRAALDAIERVSLALARGLGSESALAERLRAAADTLDAGEARASRGAA